MGSPSGFRERAICTRRGGRESRTTSVAVGAAACESRASSHSRTDRGRLRRRSAAISPSARVVVLAAVVVLAQRAHTYDEPLHQDVAGYAVYGSELLAGRALYSDLWDSRPPATNATFAAVELLVGGGGRQIFAASVGATLATLAAVVVAARRFGAAAGCWAALLWVLVSGDLRLQANQPNAEAFLNLFRTCAFAVLVTGNRSPALRESLLAGAAIALASLYKPFVLIDAACLGLAHVLGSPAGRARWRDAAAMIGTGVVIWAMLALYFAATGRAGAFTDALVRWNLFYASANAAETGGIVGNLVEGLRPGRLVPPRMLFALPLFALTMIGILAARREDARAAVLLGGWLVATLLDVALPGRFYIHYYQLWLPPLAVGAAWGIAFAVSPAGRSGRVLAGSLAAVALLVLVHRVAADYTLPVADWPRWKYGPMFLDLEPAARDLETLLAADEIFYEFGDEVGLYRLTGRRPPAGVLHATYLTTGPIADALTARTIRDLEHARPELFVVPRWLLPDDTPTHPVLRWGLEHYRPLRRTADGRFELFALRGGRIDRG